MIQEISAIVRDIVIIIVVASFIELLLPKNEFQRYVRLVVGLLIILVFLNPLSQFINLSPDLAPEFLFAQARLEGEIDTIDNADLFQDRVSEEYKKRLVEEIKRRIYNKVGEKFTIRVDVILVKEESFSPEIESVFISLMAGQNEDSTERIKPVIIDIGSQKENSEETTTRHYSAYESEIQEDIAKYFMLDKKQVEISFAQ